MSRVFQRLRRGFACRIDASARCIANDVSDWSAERRTVTIDQASRRARASNASNGADGSSGFKRLALVHCRNPQRNSASECQTRSTKQRAAASCPACAARTLRRSFACEKPCSRADCGIESTRQVCRVNLTSFSQVEKRSSLYTGVSGIGTVVAGAACRRRTLNIGKEKSPATKSEIATI
jgi:hypothetical protein